MTGHMLPPLSLSRCQQVRVIDCEVLYTLSLNLPNNPRRPAIHMQRSTFTFYTGGNEGLQNLRDFCPTASKWVRTNIVDAVSFLFFIYWGFLAESLPGGSQHSSHHVSPCKPCTSLTHDCPLLSCSFFPATEVCVLGTKVGSCPQSLESSFLSLATAGFLISQGSDQVLPPQRPSAP